MRLLASALLLLCLSCTIRSQNGDCGMRSHATTGNSRVPRIIGGNEAPVGKFPWHVQISATVDHSKDGEGDEDEGHEEDEETETIEYEESENDEITGNPNDLEDPGVTEIPEEPEDVDVTEGLEPESLCGGSIIAPRWILTAAHCLTNVINLTSVTFGSIKADEIREDKFVVPKNYTVHEEYNKNDPNHVHDIALIELQDPINFDNTASAVCLPSKATTIPEEAQVIATGSGYANNRALRNTSIPVPNVLETGFPLIPAGICSERLNEFITDTQMCAGSYGHGTAPGDSGGPVVLYSKSERWFQIGVTSTGNNTYPAIEQQDISPGVYTNVKQYCDWIEKHTRGEAKCQDAELIDATAARDDMP